MVKIGALIGAFFTTIGGFFFINALSSILGKNLSWEVIADAVSFTSGSTSVLGVISIFLFYLGIIVVLGSGFIKGTLFLKIGGGVMALGILSILVGWLIGGAFEGPYNIGGIILFLGIILYFIGCIQFRKHNIVTIFTSLLLVLLSCLLNYLGILEITQSKIIFFCLFCQNNKSNYNYMPP